MFKLFKVAAFWPPNLTLLHLVRIIIAGGAVDALAGKNIFIGE
jgi:hypothetical protein